MKQPTSSCQNWSWLFTKYSISVQQKFTRRIFFKNSRLIYNIHFLWKIFNWTWQKKIFIRNSPVIYFCIHFDSFWRNSDRLLYSLWRHIIRTCFLQSDLMTFSDLMTLRILCILISAEVNYFIRDLFAIKIWFKVLCYNKSTFFLLSVSSY